MGQQRRAGDAAGDRLRWHRDGTDAGFALATGVFGPDMLQYLHLSRDDVELFADLFADTV